MRIGVVVRVIRHHRVEHGPWLLRRRRGVEITELRTQREQRKVHAVDKRQYARTRRSKHARHAPSPCDSGSLVTSFSFVEIAECIACQARLAHFTRFGNFATPANARKEPSAF